MQSVLKATSFFLGKEAYYLCWFDLIGRSEC